MSTRESVGISLVQDVGRTGKTAAIRCVWGYDGHVRRGSPCRGRTRRGTQRRIAVGMTQTTHARKFLCHGPTGIDLGCCRIHVLHKQDAFATRGSIGIGIPYLTCALVTITKSWRLAVAFGRVTRGSTLLVGKLFRYHGARIQGSEIATLYSLQKVHATLARGISRNTLQNVICTGQTATRQTRAINGRPGRSQCLSGGRRCRGRTGIGRRGW